ncbi:hypothetical protein [Bythopirellula polymerisocia]|nr:hypothetical protein [Bythopirellula polymerisocia]
MKLLICCSSNAEEALSPELDTIEVEKLSILAPRSVERMVLPIRQVTFYRTAVDLRHQTLPPWEQGNELRISFTKAAEVDSVEERAEWRIVNMHAENFDLITDALKMDAVEVVVLNNRKAYGSYRSVDNGWVQKPLVYDVGYAIVSDARIPSKWFLTEPPGDMDEEARKVLVATFPKSFRKLKKPETKSEKETEFILSHGNDPWPELTIPGYTLYPAESQ